MPTTIGRNRRQYVLNIKATYTECRKYNPATGEMDPCDASEAWDVLGGDRTARLIENDGKASYTIRLKNDFYELREPSR